MYANGNAARIRVNRALVAGIFVGLIVAASFAFLTAHQDRFTLPSLAPKTLGGNNPAASGRDPLVWPFSRDSIWNLPIGSNARYVWGGIRHATSMAYFTDADILVLEPSAPATTVYANSDDWGAGTRCSAQGGALFTAPIPADFVVPGSHQGSPDGDTPNAAAAILAADGHTIIQTQPFARCAGQSPTSHYMFRSEDLYGTGETGSHGGSGLSALGGTVRLGELVPGGTIRHSLKLNIDSANFYPGFGGYRWPAWKSDAGGAGYGGSIPEVRMGSLLAPKADFPTNTLETEPGKILAAAFRDYGGYIVDTSGWSIYNFVTERSPAGSVQQGLGLFPQRRRRRERLGPGPRQDLHEPVRRRQLGQGHLVDRVGIERHGRRRSRNPASTLGPRVWSGSSPASTAATSTAATGAGRHDRHAHDEQEPVRNQRDRDRFRSPHGRLRKSRRGSGRVPGVVRRPDYLVL